MTSIRQWGNANEEVIEEEAGYILRGQTKYVTKRRRGHFGFEITCCGKVLMRVEDAVLEEWLKSQENSNDHVLNCPKCGDMCRPKPDRPAKKVGVENVKCCRKGGPSGKCEHCVKIPESVFRKRLLEKTQEAQP